MGGAARMLCDEAISDAISAAVSSAVEIDALNGTGRSLVEDVECNGTMVTALGGTQSGSMKATMGGTLKATIGGTLKATMGATMGQTLGATGDVPPIMPGEGLPGDDSLPTTPRPQGTFAMLQAALASDEEDDEDDSE